MDYTTCWKPTEAELNKFKNLTIEREKERKREKDKQIIIHTNSMLNKNATPFNILDSSPEHEPLPLNPQNYNSYNYGTQTYTQPIYNPQHHPQHYPQHHPQHYYNAHNYTAQQHCNGRQTYNTHNYTLQQHYNERQTYNAHQQHYKRTAL